FFFSSRRRHTRFSRDWSSDVCSSDLSKSAANFSVWLVALPWSADEKSKITDNIITRGWADPQNYKSITKGIPLKAGKFYDLKFRSEERRVGKESRSKGSEDEQRKRIE